MAGMQFEYDEKGGTFYYFLLSFLALILLPATYYGWPSDDSKEDSEKEKKKCHCYGCQSKKQTLKAKEPWSNFKRRAIKALLLLGWILFVMVAYKTSQVELDFSEFDPYKELGIDKGATVAEIKRKFRALTLTHHPDRGGDPLKFMRITKAHQALTDEQSRKNWEEYGNPDGPGATTFGIALPKWIVEKQNSVWVLAVYGLVFMVILPVVVGMWWYSSIKYSAEQILMATTQLYYHFFQRTPNMMLKRVIMILAASLEFEKGHNSEIVERPTDNEEIPLLMRDLPHLNIKSKERPLCFPYSVKARALLHAHFARIDLPPKTLNQDLQYILKKCPYLVNEMINIAAQLVALAHAGRVGHMPRLDTIENCMKLSQMVVQGLWDNRSPLLQLPHIREDMLRHFVTKRRNIRTIRQFVSMKEDDRRSLLRSLNDAEYRDVLNVCAAMPYIDLQVTSKVLDDEDTTITAGSIVTVSVRLTRKRMEELFDKEMFTNEEPEPEPDEQEPEPEEDKPEENEQESPVRKPKVWEKQKKKKGGKGGRKKPQKAARGGKPTTPAANAVATIEKKETPGTPTANGKINKSKKSVQRAHNDSQSEDNLSDATGSEAENESGDEGGESGGPEDDDADWMKFQEEAKKENNLEAKSKETHEVHCPYFPLVKYEWWWLYIADRKHHLLITAPVQVTSLKQEEEIQLKFSAPQRPGNYHYTVILRSDSYFDFDLQHNIKLDVKEAKKIESHPQWEMSEDEEEKEDEGTETEEDSQYEESDED